MKLTIETRRFNKIKNVVEYRKYSDKIESLEEFNSVYHRLNMRIFQSRMNNDLTIYEPIEIDSIYVD